jgi:hypothetical protein
VNITLSFRLRAVARGNGTRIEVEGARDSTFTAATDGCTIDESNLTDVSLRC